MILIVETEADFEGLNRCPYDGAEVRDILITHDVIRKKFIAKNVFARITSDRFSKYSDEKAERSMEKRMRWLTHEAVDAIITDRIDLLKRIEIPSTRAEEPLL